MERRELFKILTAGAAGLELASAQHRHDAKPATALDASAPSKFFTAEQMKAVDALCDIILPTDELSPGAREAQVWRYIDLMTFYGGELLQNTYRSGLKRIDAAAQAEFGARFLSLSRDRQDRIVAMAARKEDDANDELGRFFRTLKSMTIAGYHATEIGMEKHMGYRGNTAAQEFAGCDHPEHRKFDV
ncbi:MAG: gluconate 2-dehydrogenase subunit 3 family protein [Bryobacteraceae bacterium]